MPRSYMKYIICIVLFLSTPVPNVWEWKLELSLFQHGIYWKLPHLYPSIDKTVIYAVLSNLLYVLFGLRNGVRIHYIAKLCESE
jgi:hypothetical protein